MYVCKSPPEITYGGNDDVMFICEEQGGYFVAYEGKVVNTPNIQALVQRGAVFRTTSAGRSIPSQLAPVLMLRRRIPIGKCVVLRACQGEFLSQADLRMQVAPRDHYRCVFPIFVLVFL